jgi:hypothetical protein
MRLRGAGSRACGQQIPEFNGTQTVSTLFRKDPLNSVPGYFNPVHITTIFLLPVVTLSLYLSLRLTDMFLPFRLSLWYIFIHDWSCIHRYVCYMSLRSHLPWFEQLTNYWWRVKIIKLSINYLQLPVTCLDVHLNFMFIILAPNTLNFLDPLWWKI